MKSLGFACVLLVAAVSGAVASGFSDFNAGINARNDHNRDDVIRFMSRALAAPDLPSHLRPTAFYDRAAAYAANKQEDLAIADYTSALALSPGDYNSLVERGDLYEQKKQFDLARADFASAMKRRPDLLAAYASHAQVNLDENKFDDAIKDYNDGLAVSPDSLNLVVLRGEALRLSGRYDEAIKDFTAIIDSNSSYTAAYILRARAYQQSGNARAAVSDYEEAVDLEPDNLGLQEAAGMAQWEYGSYRAAARSFARSAADPKLAAFSYLWLQLTGFKRGTQDGDLAQQASALDLAAWPGPIVKLFLGQAAPDDVIAAARQGDPEKQKDHLCEADFFVAEWQIFKSDAASAKRLLTDAVATCRGELPESHIAHAELARMGA